MKKILSLFLVSIFTITLFAIPPKPPIGKRWVLNPDFSDEFNGTKLDDSKWYDYHPTWKGRAPAIFLPSQVSVSDGYLKIKNKKLEKDTIITNWNGSTTTYSMAGGAVRSKTDKAFYGYYECKFKASKTHMSTTFWLSSAQSKAGPANCTSGDDKYGLELDIQETIGVPDLGHTADFHTGMGSNTHYWYTDCDGAQHDYNKSVKSSSSTINSDVFNTYGAWWKDATEVSFVFNDNTPKNVAFNTSISPTPFDYSMAMNMVTETYSWITLPTDEELADDTRNTSYYDWVRSYILVDVQTPNEQLETDPNIATNGDFETGDLTGWTGWGSPGANIVSDAEQVYAGKYSVHILGAGAPEQNITTKTNTSYILTCYAKAISGNITIGVKSNSTGISIASIEVTGDQYKKYSLTFNTTQYDDLKVYFYAQAGEEGFADNFEIVEENPLVPEPDPIINIYEEKVTIDKEVSDLPASKLLSIPYTYMANEDRTIHFELRKPDNTLVKDTTLQVYAGYGNTSLELALEEKPEAANGYKIIASMRTINPESSVAISTDQINLNISVPTSSSQINTNNAIRLYPNPAENSITVSGIDSGTWYKIYNSSGMRVLEGYYSGEKINIDKLKSGLYFLQTENNSAKFIKKI